MSEAMTPTAANLTLRQREVAGLLCSTGLSYKQVADKLDISEGTMRKHTENVYRRVGVHSRAELMMALRDSTK
jgi:DNA-binding NarL/FixJ family response regulator